jgi:hypothetical protein
VLRSPVEGHGEATGVTVLTPYTGEWQGYAHWWFSTDFYLNFILFSL